MISFWAAARDRCGMPRSFPSRLKNKVHCRYRRSPRGCYDVARSD